MIAPIHTLANELGTVKISGSRLENVTVKNAFGRTFSNVTTFYYTATNLVTGETATYAHLEIMPGTLERNIVPFLFEKLAWYNKNGWYVSYGDVIVDLIPA